MEIIYSQPSRLLGRWLASVVSPREQRAVLTASDHIMWRPLFYTRLLLLSRHVKNRWVAVQVLFLTAKVIIQFMIEFRQAKQLSYSSHLAIMLILSLLSVNKLSPIGEALRAMTLHLISLKTKYSWRKEWQISLLWWAWPPARRGKTNMTKAWAQGNLQSSSANNY